MSKAAQDQKSTTAGENDCGRRREKHGHQESTQFSADGQVHSEKLEIRLLF